ncbi:MAG: peptidyl-prolyl cis-trans isomerase [Gammaproteobacteria bacterium]|nr:peptidyl-prolyl cis-trans isomerase [Gammaproteobacteria bacterium]
MSRLTRIALPLFAVIGLGLSSLALANSPVLATVNGKTITQQDYDRFIQENAADANAPRNEVINELITRELLSQDAARQGLEKRKDVQDAIAAARRDVILGAALAEAVGKPPISDAELRKLYNEEVAKLNPQDVKASQIVVADQQTAERIITELDMGGNFAEIAKKQSIDNSAEQGGELGWLDSQSEFARAILSLGLEKGKYNNTPVQSQIGWHIVRLDDIRKGTPPPFEAVRPQLVQIIERQRLNSYLLKLRDGAKIEVSN